MAALSNFVVRRVSSSSLILRSLGSSSASVLHLQNRLFDSRFLPFSTASANTPSVHSSPRSATVAGFRNSEQTAFGTSEKLSLLDGLSFDSIEGTIDGTLTLRRKTENEIIEIRVKEEMDDDHESTMHVMRIKFRYGDNFKKRMDFNVVVFPGDQGGEAFIKDVTLSVDASEDDSQAHVDELDGFFEKRGINRSNMDFLVKHIQKRKEYEKYFESNGESVSPDN